MRSTSRLALLASAIMLAPPALAAAPQSVPIPTLVSQVTIPHTSFKLKNGLTVIVHEDHKAPVAAVSVWYNVGSKDEPAGKTGFAHLFEHLMFNGSENLPGDYFTYLQQVGATDYNGTTGTGPHQLFRDRARRARSSARCSWKATAWATCSARSPKACSITSAASSRTRKGRATAGPAGSSNMTLFENLFPEGHPYHHTMIGSMADLDAASLGDVKQWFRDKYGPNNAVLVVRRRREPGRRSRRLAERYFGADPARAGQPSGAWRASRRLRSRRRSR